jgi:nanoRNase/pAp phosphatase (c-di-AMP/oligoRNAs hydrolase)
MSTEPATPELRTAKKNRSRKDRLKDLYAQFQHKDHVLITIDPDPDAIGSALALKRLLWHKVQSCTIGIIRPIRRLNNLTMVRLLRLPLVQLKPGQIPKHNKCVVVDGQPHHNELFRQFAYDVVIDHHPLNTSIDAPFVDVRPECGSTSTIFTEYLKAAGIKPSQTVATALIYGIKTDTRSFERHTTVDDIEAFRHLFSLANHSVLRKIEISDLSLKDLVFFHKAVERMHVVKDRMFVHLDEVTTADILVEIAEFLLKVHNISWSIISGIFEGNLIIIVRNDGYRKDAGKLVRRAFGELGCAGGHHAMARAEIPLQTLVQHLGSRSSLAIEGFIRKQMSPIFKS